MSAVEYYLKDKDMSGKGTLFCNENISRKWFSV